MSSSAHENRSTEATKSASSLATKAKNDPDEEDLKRELRAALQIFKKREPLENSYKHLLMNAVVTPRKPALPKDRLYKPVGARLRDRVESFMQQTEGGDPMDRLSSREPIEEDAMRSAFTLRGCKKHEQEALLKASLAALPRRNGMDYRTRQRQMEGIAMGLQNREPRTKRAKTTKSGMGVSPDDIAKNQKESEQLKRQQQREERARKKRKEVLLRREEERREEEDRRARMMESPQQKLYRYYEPILQVLWDMEFQNLGGTNPFRIVIDKDNCAQMGAPDYCTIITKPMNLTWIKQKAKKLEYETLEAFFNDVELLIKNALRYNSDPNNDFHLAAKEMSRKYVKMKNVVVAKLLPKK